VDTVASIVLNGHEVGTVENMFMSYSFEITQFLNTNDDNNNINGDQNNNTLEVRLKSALK